MLSWGDKRIRFLWGKVKPFIRGKILFTPDTPASRSVIHKGIRFLWGQVKPFIRGKILFTLGDKGTRFLWGQVKPFIRGRILFTPDMPASRSVIHIGHYSLIPALIGRQGDPLSMGPGQAFHQGQDSLYT